MYRSISTINAALVHRHYGEVGDGVVWAVIDSGIDATHPHFAKYGTLDLPAPLQHQDFEAADGTSGQPLRDEYGHGTIAASVIAGALGGGGGPPVAVVERRMSETGAHPYELTDVASISGLAPRCKLVSLKVLDPSGSGMASTILRALDFVQQVNDFGRRLLIHGVHLGVYYPFDPKWFACGLSPLCVEVDRLVRSGVVVIAAAGNTGYGTRMTKQGQWDGGMESTIADPGNAELAITVGSTHRELPHLYGVSYFSAKGPTLDGRRKPDLVAPGDQVAVALTGRMREEALGDLPSRDGRDPRYGEQSSTSIAAAHVSGAVAAMLSVRRDLVGQPERIKQLLLASAIDLGREQSYQGAGLLNLLGALQPQSIELQPGAQRPAVTDPLRHEAAALPLAASGSASTPSAVPDVAKSPFTAASANAPVATARRAVRVLCCYAHKDVKFLVELKAHLSPLSRQGVIDLWYDRQISAGTEWRKEIASALKGADIILLLVSAYFMDSDFISDIELQRALERHEAGTARVIPVIARSVVWEDAPFAKLQALPRDGKAVQSWRDQHDAWTEVARGVREAALELRAAD